MNLQNSGSKEALLATLQRLQVATDVEQICINNLSFTLTIILLQKLPALTHIRGIHLKMGSLSEKAALRIWTLIQLNPNIDRQLTQFEIENRLAQLTLEIVKREDILAQLTEKVNALQHKRTSSDDSSEPELLTKKMKKKVHFAAATEEYLPVHTVLGFHADCGPAQNLHTAIERKESGSIVIIKSKLNKNDFQNICAQPCRSPEYFGIPALFLAAQIFDRFELISQLLSCGAPVNTLVSGHAAQEIAHLNIMHFCCLRGDGCVFAELEKNLDKDDMAMLANERVFAGIYYGLTALDILCLQVQKHSENFELDDVTKELLTKLISIGAKSSIAAIDAPTNDEQIGEKVDYVQFVMDICNRLRANKYTVPRRSTALAIPTAAQFEVRESAVGTTRTEVSTALAIPVTVQTEATDVSVATADIENPSSATVSAARSLARLWQQRGIADSLPTEADVDAPAESQLADSDIALPNDAIRSPCGR